ncbi:MAG: 4,5-dihydroxyphthalate decarboxylase [Chloroflexota bacterium]|nr:4,5-dihydroxyphthalate decarboxylase [Chloroflexota bacterium]
MAKLSLTLAVTVLDRTRAILDGTIRPEGIDLNCLPMSVEEIFWRMSKHSEFDVSEMSGTAYMLDRAKADPRFIAVPVFLSRSFRHSGMYVHAGSGIERPEDLVGKRVGAPEYAVTAVTWIRGMLKHEYGIEPSDLHWMIGGQESPGREERAYFVPPAGVTIEPLPPGATLNDMLVKGEIDAMFAPRIPKPFAEGNPAIRRLFPDVQAVEEDYYRRTKIFPIMHILVMKQEIYREHPWVAESLYKAFRRAKEECMQAMYDATAIPCSLPWFVQEIERERRVFGYDLWPYGIEESRPTLEAMVQYHVEQELIPRAIPIEELFATPTVNEFKI